MERAKYQTTAPEGFEKGEPKNPRKNYHNRNARPKSKRKSKRY